MSFVRHSLSAFDVLYKWLRNLSAVGDEDEYDEDKIYEEKIQESNEDEGNNSIGEWVDDQYVDAEVQLGDNIVELI